MSELVAGGKTLNSNLVPGENFKKICSFNEVNTLKSCLRGKIFGKNIIFCSNLVTLMKQKLLKE